MVTGGLGFLGRAVVASLASHGNEVVAITHSKSHASLTDAARTEKADVRNAEELCALLASVRPDAVCHLAALTSGRESFMRPIDYYEVNTTGTINLLRAIASTDTPETVKVIFASTSAVYGSGRSGALNEDDPTRPESPYAASKLAAEQVIRSYSRIGRIEAAVLRCFNIAGATAEGYGDPDQTRIISTALCAARGEIPHVTVNGDGSVVREFTHVLDVAEAVRLALDAIEPGDGQVFNIGTGQGVSMMEVVRTAERVTGTQIQTVHRPPVQEAHTLIANPTRAHETLGWKPERSSLAQVITDAWQAGR